MSFEIGCKKVCSNCPYRKDAPLQLWDIYEFEKLLNDAKASYGLGAIYDCHKNNGSICKGWLVNQLENDIPSNTLRIVLRTSQTKQEELDTVLDANKDIEMYKSIEEMSFANYPELKDYHNEKTNF
jgi:hypothetical protein